MLPRPTLLAASLFVGSLFALQACAGAPVEDENVNPSRGDAIKMAACGTVLGTFDGSDAHSNGDDTGSGYSCDGSGAYGLQYQCVELVQRHFKTHWSLSWSGNAKDLLNNAPKSKVDVFDNGDGAHPPVPGDMIVWTNGAYGHVALVTAVHSNGIEILEQNVKGTGKATLDWDGATIGARWTTWVPAGWAHAKANGDPVTSGSGGTGGGTTTSSSTSAGTGGSPATSSSAGTGGSPGTSSSAGTGGNVGWDCNQSAYNGSQFWTCSNGNLYECQGGVAHEQTCAAGCNVNAVGTDDTCKQQGVSWDCTKSAYNGAQYWTCSGGNLYECQNGVAQEQTCALGCNVNAVGTNDTCKQQGVTWSCANSAYNGSQYWTCSGGNLYECQNGVPQEQTCANGCQVHPVGTNDTCL
jgi:hypothetical protein